MVTARRSLRARDPEGQLAEEVRALQAQLALLGKQLRDEREAREALERALTSLRQNPPYPKPTIQQELAPEDWLPATVWHAPLTAVLASPVPLTTTYQNLVSVVADRSGWWEITGAFSFVYSGAGDDNQLFRGQLLVGGVAQPTIGAFRAVAPQQFVAEKTWRARATAGDTFMLQAKKDGGTGASFIGAAHTSISAAWLGP